MLPVNIQRQYLINSNLFRHLKSCINRRGIRTLNGVIYSGHNKWSTIKHQKMKNDAMKNKIANKISLQIALAAKQNDTNQLNSLIELATKSNVSKKVVENAIKKGTSGGSSNGQDADSNICVYEGMGPGGVAFVIESTTNNKNRTISLVRSAFTKANGSMTPTLYQFDRRGYLEVLAPKNLDSEEKVLELGLEIEGVEDIEPIAQEERIQDEESISLNPGNDEPLYEVIITDPSDTNQVADDFIKAGFIIREQVRNKYIPKRDMVININDEDIILKLA